MIQISVFLCVGLEFLVFNNVQLKAFAYILQTESDVNLFCTQIIYKNVIKTSPFTK